MASQAINDAWYVAVNKNDLKAGERLLDENKGKLDINAVVGSYTALGIACQFGYTEYAAMLIKRGADIKKASLDPDSRPLRYACWKGHTDCVRLLLDAGADINEQDKDGWTALMLAAHFGRADTVRLLLDRGADRSLKDKDGKTALDLAKEEKHAAVVAVLSAPSIASGAASSHPSAKLSVIKPASTPGAASAASAAVKAVAPTTETKVKTASPAEAELRALFTKLDLLEYLPTFIDEAYTVATLSHIDKDELAKLIPKGGHRAALLKHINTAGAAGGVPEATESKTAVSSVGFAGPAGSASGDAWAHATATVSTITTAQDVYWEVEDDFKAGLNLQIEDYNKHRIEKKLNPITFKLVGVEKVVNPFLQARFDQRLAAMKAAGRSAEHLRARRAFHGTRPPNIKKICDKGLLRVGHPLNPSKAVDEGFFGMPQHGVYVSRYADYTFKYSNQLEALNVDETCKVIMFHVLPGNSLHIKKQTSGLKPSEGYDSHSSSNHQEWYLFDESQCLPVYVLTVKAIESRRTAADDV